MTREQIHKLISLIDLTTLDNKDNDASVLNLINKGTQGIEGIKPAAICCYSQFSELVSRETNISNALVGGYFPTGQASLLIKQKELEVLAASAANEIDIVINRGEVVNGNYGFLQKEVEQARALLKGKILKVIIESGELNQEQIAKASRIAIESGADFIKTSTGKSTVGATPEAARIMCSEIRTWKESKGKKVGFKASGGIRTFDDAMIYHNIVAEELGQEWLKPELFRIGASSLYDHLEEQLKAL